MVLLFVLDLGSSKNYRQIDIKKLKLGSVLLTKIVPGLHFDKKFYQNLQTPILVGAIWGDVYSMAAATSPPYK